METSKLMKFILYVQPNRIRGFSPIQDHVQYHTMTIRWGCLLFGELHYITIVVGSKVILPLQVLCVDSITRFCWF